MLRVGLTGGIASGKSTVLRMFRDLGCITVDADAIVAKLYEPGEAGHDAIVRAYGRDVLSPDGAIDRKKLAAVAFSSADEARKLNALIHPLVIAEEGRMLREHADAMVVVEATLLLEAGGRERYDRIVVVDVAPEVQLARATARGLEREEVLQRVAHQMPRQERLRHADYVIVNDGDERALLGEVQRVYALLRADAERRRDGGAPSSN